jgi:hypothetical protein
MNLVSLIMKFLTPDMIGRIASALGADIASMGLNEAAPACSPAASVRFRW